MLYRVFLVVWRFVKISSHTHHIYSYLRVIPAAMITEHHSLCIRNRDLVCCNSLRKIHKLNPEIAFVDTSSGSSLTQAVVCPSSPVPNTVQALAALLKKVQALVSLNQLPVVC